MSYIFRTLLSNPQNYGGVRDTSNIKYIVIHYTANDGDSDENNAKYFHNNVVKASAHYFVDDDSVTQSVLDHQIAWSVGGSKYANCSTTGGGKYYKICTNTNSISIELCDTVKNGAIKPTQATINNAIELTKKLMKTYNIPQANVIRHFDTTGKTCPAYWCGSASNDALWKTEFWNKLVDIPAVQTTTTTTKPTETATSITSKGMTEAVKFVGKSNSDINKMKAMVLQTAINKDYKSGLTVDGIFGTKSKDALGTHYVKKGEKQYMVTAAEILMYLNGLNPNGVEYPGIYGNGLVNAVKTKFGGDGIKITASNFLSLTK